MKLLAKSYCMTIADDCPGLTATARSWFGCLRRPFRGAVHTLSRPPPTPTRRRSVSRGTASHRTIPSRWSCPAATRADWSRRWPCWSGSTARCSRTTSSSSRRSTAVGRRCLERCRSASSSSTPTTTRRRSTGASTTSACSRRWVRRSRWSVSTRRTRTTVWTARWGTSWARRRGSSTRDCSVWTTWRGTCGWRAASAPTTATSTSSPSSPSTRHVRVHWHDNLE